MLLKYEMEVGPDASLDLEKRWYIMSCFLIMPKCIAFFLYLKEVSFAHQGCIYLVINTVIL